MNWLVMKQRYQKLFMISPAQQIFELGLSLLLGLLVGVVIVISWGFSPGVQGIVFLLPIGFVFVMLINDLEKTVLAVIALSVPLNLDFSLIISPYARNAENIARGNQTIVALTELRVSLVSLVLVVGYSLWMLTPRGMGRQRARFFPGTTIPALGLIFISILSAYQAKDLQLAFFRIVQLIELFLAYFYLVNHLNTRKRMYFFVTALMWGLFIESLLMILQWVTGLRFWFAGIDAVVYQDPRRVGGTLGGPNVAGGVLSAFLIIDCVMIWLFPKRREKAFAVVCFLSCFVALIATASRASWAGFLGAFVAFISIGFGRGWVQKRTLVLLLIATVVVALVFYPVIYTRLTADDRGSAESRIKMARLAWNVIRANTWLGVGANNYALVAADYYTSDVGYLGYILYSAVHNRYLLTWAEVGLFGLLIYISFLVSPLIQVWSHVKSSDRFISLLGLSLGCAAVSMSIQMLAEHFNARPSALFVWILMALITSLQNFELAQSTSSI